MFIRVSKVHVSELWFLLFVTGAAGGICETYKPFDENGENVLKSLNTGIVTIINYGAKVPPKVSVLTFAHEVGHNFGAAHDSDAHCTPYTSFNDQNGNFIMFASATSGDRPNNRLFSNCSKNSIAAVSSRVKPSKLTCELLGYYSCNESFLAL